MMGNVTSSNDDDNNKVTVTRKSTWSTTMSTGDEGSAITEHAETITEHGVTHEKFTTATREKRPRREDLRGDLSPGHSDGGSGSGRDHRGKAPSAPPPGSDENTLPTTTDACPRPEEGTTGNLGSGGGNREEPPSAPQAESKEDEEKMDEGGEDMRKMDEEGGEDMRKMDEEGGEYDFLPDVSSAALSPDQENPLHEDDQHRTLHQPPFHHEEKDPPPPYTPGNPPEYTQQEKEASRPQPVTLGADPRENPDLAQELQHQGSDPSTSQSHMDSTTTPCQSGSGSGNFLSRFFNKPKETAKMERDTVYKTKNIETARAMIKCDEESEKKMMDITQAILDDLRA